MQKISKVKEDAAVCETRNKRLLMERSKKWQLTENNATYTKDEVLKLLSGVGETYYAIACSEIGESGTSHIHAFVVYKNAIALGSLKKLFPRAHFEHCRGSNVKNREYVVKQDKNFVEIGELPLATYDAGIDDASEVVALILKGVAPLQILRDYPLYTDYVVKNLKNLNEIFKMSISDLD